MREKRNFDSRRNVLQSDRPKSKYFLVFEGSQTEQIYFDAVVDHRTEIGISKVRFAYIEVLDRIL